MECKYCKIFDPEALVISKGLRLSEALTMNIFVQEPISAAEKNITASSSKEFYVSNSLACSCCKKLFANYVEQREHYKSDWHRFNLKNSLCNDPIIAEENFSLNQENNLSPVCLDKNIIKKQNEKNKSSLLNNFATRQIKIYFENEKNEVFSIYKCLLQHKSESLACEDLLSAALNLITKPQNWMIVLLGGGYFAAAIFDNNVITHHKTFHSYTVRKKQGSSQFIKEKKGGHHPKSAGASLRRYNEEALIKHVQEILSTWSSIIKQCNLILFRASGPWNKSILFDSKKAPFCKTDKRLRSITFPTRRATFKEVKRIHDILSTLEIYGCVDDIKKKFLESSTEKLKNKQEKVKFYRKTKKGNKISKNKNVKTKMEGHELQKKKEIIEASSESSSDNDYEVNLTWNDTVIDFSDLQEYEDILPTNDKKIKNNELNRKRWLQKKRNKLKAKDNLKLKEKTKKNQIFNDIQKKLIDSCRSNCQVRLSSTLNLINNFLDDKNCKNNHSCNVFTKQDFIDCLNASLEEKSGNTLLHICALENLSECVPILMQAGADPTIKNKNKQTPYSLVKDKKTQNSFRQFRSIFPEAFNFGKANIPLPLTDKEEKKKLKRVTEKMNKLKIKNTQLEIEKKEKFLALSDREKITLNAESQLTALETSNLKSKKPLIMLRCFQCGLNISEKIPFEYGSYKFCSISCLKDHRAKTHSYGLKF